MRARTSVVLLASCVGIASISTAVAATASGPTTNAPRFFQNLLRAGDPGDALRSVRPPPAQAAKRARAIAVLPATGELRPSEQEQANLALLQPVLVYHERAQVFETKVIDIPQAAVALYERAILLISRPALRLLSGAELQALIAHEIGHDYFWPEFERTLAHGDRRGRQELELKCDGIAVLTLVGLTLDPAHLLAGLRKQLRFNEMLGADANAADYPQLHERQFITAVRDLAQLNER